MMLGVKRDIHKFEALQGNRLLKYEKRDEYFYRRI